MCDCCEAMRRRAGSPDAALLTACVRACVSTLWLRAHFDGPCLPFILIVCFSLSPAAIYACLSLPSPSTTVMLPSGSRKSVVDVTRCCIIGLRDVDAGERDHMTALGLRRQKNFFTMRDLDELGMLEVMRRALQTVAPSGGPFALSIDMDCMDPGVAPGTGTQVPGGLSYREGHLAMEVMADHGGLRYMDVVEMNPISDKQNVTGNMAVNMVECVLGKEIY